MCKSLIRRFSKGHMQMAYKQLVRCATLLITKEWKSKLQWKYLLIGNNMFIIWKMTIANVGKVKKKIEFLCDASENIKWTITLENNLAVPQNAFAVAILIGPKTCTQILIEKRWEITQITSKL